MDFTRILLKRHLQKSCAVGLVTFNPKAQGKHLELERRRRDYCISQSGEVQQEIDIL